MLFECIGICVLSPVHDCVMRCSLVFSADCEILIGFCLHSATVYLTGIPCRDFSFFFLWGGGGDEIFFKRGLSTYRDYSE